MKATTGWKAVAPTYAEYRRIVESELVRAYRDGVPMDRVRAARLVTREVAPASAAVVPASSSRNGANAAVRSASQRVSMATTSTTPVRFTFSGFASPATTLCTAASNS